MFTHTALRRTVARSHDAPVSTLFRVDAGQNHTYRVTLRDGRELFLKVGTRFPDAFAAEPETVALVRRRTAIPVPEVFAVGTEPLGYPFALYEFVPDSAPDWVRDLDPAVAERLCREAGETLAALHEIEFPAFGRLGVEDGSLAVVDPTPYPDALRASLDRQLEQLRDSPFAAHCDRLETLGVQLVEAADLDGVDPVLVHGDYRLDNLRVDPTADPVTRAVVDWELPTAGDPLWDAVTTCALLTTGYGMPTDRECSLAAAFWTGYGPPAFDTARWRCYELLARLRLARHLDVELAGLSAAARSERVTQHRETLDALLAGDSWLARPAAVL